MRFLALTTLLLLGCPGPADDTADTSVADTDTDTDSDADADTDTDTDSDADTDIEVGDPARDLVIETCSNTLPTPASGETCVVEGNWDTATHVLVTGRVMAPDKIYEDGEVLFGRAENAPIECVGCDCDEPTNTVVISCPNGAISPGLINAHDHIRYNLESPASYGDERFDHRHDWRTGARGHTDLGASSDNSREAVLYGEMRMLFSGTTSIAGSISSVDASGLLRNIDNAEYNEGLGGGSADYDTFPLGDQSGTLRSSGCGDYSIRSTSVLGNRVYLPHIAEGIDAEANNEFACTSSNTGGGTNLIADNTSIIHGIGLTPADIELMANEGAHLVWSPRSNVSLYGMTANVVTHQNMGVPVAMGTDWTPSGSATMLRELACADYLNENHYNAALTHRDLFLMATRNGAIALGTEGQLGELSPGAIADIAIYDSGTRTGYDAVIRAELADTVMVLRGGKPLYGDTSVLSGIYGSGAGSCESLSGCLSDFSVCIADDAGITLAAVKSGIGSGVYNFAQCGVPNAEPTCVPMRNNEDNDGLLYPTSATDDWDGDGIEDAFDLCPDVFDPPRPLEDFVQGDYDSDGIGDACDACPTTGGETGCDWLDLDSDGVVNLDDNCPNDANDTQLDGDGDGIGDVCDDCPAFASASGACPVLVYDVKDGTVALGAPVAIENMLVTAVKDERGFFSQLVDGQPGFVSAEYSGVWSYAPGLPLPEVGDLVTVEGAVKDFFGQTQLDGVSRIVVQSSGNDAPDPIVDTTANLGTGGSKAAAYEGVLVRVEDAQITALQLEAGPGDSDPSNEYELDGVLPVDDYLYLTDPYPTVGETWDSVTGVLRWAHDKSVVLPRDATDIVSGPAKLSGFDPELVQLPTGSSTSVDLWLQRPAAAAETVTISCDGGASLSCPSSVVFNIGQQMRPVTISGGVASTTAISMTADLNSSTVEATVWVYDNATPREVVGMSPDPVPATTDGSVDVTVWLNLPAPTGGSTVTLSAGSLLTVPSSVDVLEGDDSATFTVDAGPDAGTETLTATLGVSVDVDVIISALPSGSGLFFSQYIEGSSGTNKVLEIYNADSNDQNLDDCEVTVLSNGNTSGSGIDLDDVTLAFGETFVLCNSSNTITSTECDQSTGSLTFNGNDALTLVCGGTTSDVFGKIGEDPGSDGWGAGTKDKNLMRNCSVTSGDPNGSDDFDPAAQWTEGPVDGVDDLGTHCD